MTPSSSMLAIADDLTGAAEIAAVGFRAGWSAQVATAAGELADADLIALDTDTRLASPEMAARALAAAGAAAARRDWRLIYKKTDSVLRGPVLAEITALAAALGKKTVLLVPANPSLGRVIRGGRYFVHGTPLDATTFARDPHHPARTSVVADLLGRGADVRVLPVGSPLPSSGVVVGEVESAADVRTWAERVTPDVLPAGGGEFFAAVLRDRVGAGSRGETPAETGQPTLLVSGSTAAPHRAAGALVLPRACTDGDDESAFRQWSAQVMAALARQNFVSVMTPAERSVDHQAPTRIREAFARLVRAVMDARAARHLMIEGGATAAAILAALDWKNLFVAREWAQGVVTLRPAVTNSLLVTMKPGSYLWPEALWSHVTAAR